MLLEPHLLFAVGVGALGLVIVFLLRRWVLQQPVEHKEAIKVATWIKQGARAFLKREFTTVAYFIAAISAVLGILAFEKILEYHIVIGFIVGSILSLLMAYIGMETATDANVRTTEAGRRDPLKAFLIGYRGGAVTGLALVSLSILGIGLLYIFFGNPSLIVGFGFGASLAALFAQVGGGIYTKSADIGADLVGKVEKRIPEDDPRNAGVIADLVGDNVGDCAGRASDLFESFSDNLIAIMILGWFVAVEVFGNSPQAIVSFIVYPLVLQAVGLLANIVGLFVARSKDPTKAVAISYLVSGIVIALGFYLTAHIILDPLEVYFGADPLLAERLYIAAMLGLLGSMSTVFLVLYYTGLHKGPVKEIVKYAEGGAALDILAGTSLGMESTFPEVVIIGLVMVAAFFIGAGTLDFSKEMAIMGLYGASMAVLGLLSMTGIIQTSDTFGPIVDNADGIATMAGLEEEVGTSLEVLDSVGNTTKALTKAYGMAAALLTGVSVLFAYVAEVLRILGISVENFQQIIELLPINILNPLVIFGLMVGAGVPFLFSAWTIKGAQRGAFGVVKEVKRQFDENPAILEGKAYPDYAKAVDIATKAALVDMVMPTLLGLFMVIIVGISFGLIVLAAYLIALKIVSALLAVYQFNAGGALDNAKKLVEISGKKGTDLHAATVIGDTFGDPLKDTAGPSLHILIKLSNILAITLIPLFALMEKASLTTKILYVVVIIVVWIVLDIIIKVIRKRMWGEHS